MKNIHARLVRLETVSTITNTPITVCRFIIHSLTDDPLGYTLRNGDVILRHTDESLDDFMQRCHDSLIPGTHEILTPIFK